MAEHGSGAGAERRTLGKVMPHLEAYHTVVLEVDEDTVSAIERSLRAPRPAPQPAA
jgi:hypothetical protein